METAVEFGFVPKQVVADLQDIGNWKSRATAIDTLQRALTDVSDKRQLVAGLGAFVSFLVTLVADPNFKIALSSMQIMEALVAKMGPDIEPHLRAIVPALLEKFTDSKILVRKENVKVLHKVLAVGTPRKVFDLVAAGTSHSSWRVREEVANLAIMAMLTFDRHALDFPQLFKTLLTIAGDSKERVRIVAIEGLVLISKNVGNYEFGAMCTRSSAPDDVRAAVAARLASSPASFPKVGADGLVEHCVEFPAEGGVHEPGMMRGSFATADPASRPSSYITSIGKLPWEVSNPRPRLRSGQADGSASPLPSINVGGYTPSLANGMHTNGHTSSSSPTIKPLSSDPDHLWSPSYGGQGGSPYSNSRLSKENAASSASSTYTSPSHQATSASSQHNKQQPGSGHSWRDHRNSSSGGSSSDPAALPLHASQINTMGSRAPDGRLNILSELRKSPRTSQNGPHSFTSLSSHAPASPTVSVQGLATLKQHPWASGNTTASQEFASRMGVHALTPSYSLPTAALSAARGTAPGSSTEHPGFSLWLQTDLEPEHPAHRTETYSPSKGELLANLKRRQVEKRANSAQLAERPSGTANMDRLPSAAMMMDDLTREFSLDRHSNASANGDPFGVQSGLRRNLFSDRDNAPIMPNQHKPLWPTTSGNGTIASTNSAPLDSGSNGFGGHRIMSGRRNNRPSAGSSGFGLDPSDQHDKGSSSSSYSSAPQPAHSSPPDFAQRSGYGAGASTRQASTAVSPSRSNGVPPKPRTAECASPQRPLSQQALSNKGDPPVGTWDKNAKPDVWDKGPSNLDELTTAELKPVEEPEKRIRSVIAKLIEVNNADRKLLDWQGQFVSLTDARRIVKHHPEVIKGCLHEFVRAAVPSVDHLRSYTVKNALLMFQEMFQSLGRGLDKELDEIVPTLLKKAGEVSQAGRENFLSGEADKALSEMCRNVTEARAVAALTACANHKSMHSRAKVASHLDELLELSGPALLANWPALERLFKTAAGFLDEGALETRTYGKRLIWNAKVCCGNKHDFDRLLASLQPEAVQKRVIEVIEGLNGPPVPPSKAASGPAASRANSRQLPERTASDMSSQYASSGTNGGSTGGYGNGVGSFLERQASVGRSGNVQSAPNGSSSSGSGPPGRGPGSITPLKQRSFIGRSRTVPDDGNGVYDGDRPSGGSNGGDGGGRSSNTRSNILNGGSNSSNGRMQGGGSGSGGEPAMAETIAKAMLNLGSKDFRERSEGLKAVEAMAPQLASAPDTMLVSVMDAVTGRLADGNSKVNILALEVAGRLFEVLRERCAVGLNTLIPALAANLGSGNDKIRSVAVAAADVLLRSVDPSLLVQNFSHCVSHGHLRGKPMLVEKLQAIISATYPTKAQLVIKYAVPAALSLLNDGKGEAKAASTQLLSTLARLMGASLLEYSRNLTPQLQQRVADAVNAVA